MTNNKIKLKKINNLEIILFCNNRLFHIFVRKLLPGINSSYTHKWYVYYDLLHALVCFDKIYKEYKNKIN